MAPLVNSIGLVIVLGEHVMPDLADLAARLGWTVLETATFRQAAPVILRRRADLHVVQVSARVDEAVGLIRLLRTAPRKVPILAVAAEHYTWLEQAARQAGATCYLPGGNGPEALAQAAARMLPVHAGRSAHGLRVADR